MEDLFGKYLMSSYGDSNKKPCHNNKEERNKCMVIVESRDSFWLSLVIKNAICKCRDFNLYVISSSAIITKVRSVIDGDFKTQCIENASELRSIANYNLLLTSASFWEMFNEEEIVIFQLDSIFLREPKVEEYAYDMLGAVCGQVGENSFVINGGFSYRKKSAMIRACQEMEQKGYDRTQSEDILFTDVLRKGDYRFPTMEDCNNFAIESFGNVETCIGVHGTDKYYLCPEMKTALEKYIKEEEEEANHNNNNCL